MGFEIVRRVQACLRVNMGPNILRPWSDTLGNCLPECSISSLKRIARQEANDEVFINTQSLEIWQKRLHNDFNIEPPFIGQDRRPVPGRLFQRSLSWLGPGTSVRPHYAASL